MGEHLRANTIKLDKVEDRELKVALHKCHEHLRLVRKLKTDYGAHTEERLKDDPYNYYIKRAFEAIASGDWEWKNRTLYQQMIRIMNSHISTEVDKYRSAKKREESDPPPIFVDIEKFHSIASDNGEISEAEAKKYESQVKLIEEAIQDDELLVDIWLHKLEGKSRAEIAVELNKSRKVKKHAKEQHNG